MVVVWGGGGRLGPPRAPKKFAPQAIVPAYRIRVIGAGLRGHGAQRHLATTVLT